MKTLILALCLLTQISYAHDDGHGPKLGDQPKFGGKVTAAINKKEVKKGRDATMLYKGELTKTGQNMVRIYLYNKKMKPLKLENVGDAYAEVIYKDRETRKWTKKKFDLEKKNGSFEGKIPGNPRRPFNIDVTIKHDEKNLFMAFDNLH